MTNLLLWFQAYCAIVTLYPLSYLIWFFLLTLIFHPHEVVWKLAYTYLLNLRLSIYKSWCFNTHFTPNNNDLFGWYNWLKTVVVGISDQRVKHTSQRIHWYVKGYMYFILYIGSPHETPETTDVYPWMVSRWPSVCDAGPTLNHPWVMCVVPMVKAHEKFIASRINITRSHATRIS